MSDRADPNLARLAAAHQALGHLFQEEDLLIKACTHASRCGAQASAQQKREQANERLEFLGDALLGAALCLQLFRRFPEADEGELSRWKARLASREVLAKAIEGVGLLPHCLVGAQMGVGGPETWPVSVKANFCESLLAAVFLDGGFAVLHTAVERLLGPLLEDPVHGHEDPRQQLQIWCLEQHKELPTYCCSHTAGTAHAPIFTASVTAGEQTACGTGPSRKRAESAAAQALLKSLG